MRCSPQQLLQRLERGLAPVYLLFGDEPLQLREASDAIRRRAEAVGFSERSLLEQGPDFDWSMLAAEAGSLSLFADRRLIEVRLTGEGVGRDGGEALRAHCERLTDDVLLLLIAPKLDWKTLKSKWAQVLDRAGVIVQARPLQGRQLQQWLAERLRAKGFMPDQEALSLLAERVEGNLLAADQEIAKLALLRDPGPLDAQTLLRVVHDSARYDLFDLSDAALAGDRARALRVLQGLMGEGTAEPLLLWVLAREIRRLAAIADAQARRQNLAAVFQAQKVWESRQGVMLAAAKRLSRERLWLLLLACAQADLVIKGQAAGDAGLLLAEIVQGLSGNAETSLPEIARRC